MFRSSKRPFAMLNIVHCVCHLKDALPHFRTKQALRIGMGLPRTNRSHNRRYCEDL